MCPHREADPPTIARTTVVLEEATKQGILPRQAAVALAERRVRGAMAYRRWSSTGTEDAR